MVGWGGQPEQVDGEHTFTLAHTHAHVCTRSQACTHSSQPSTHSLSAQSLICTQDSRALTLHTPVGGHTCTQHTQHNSMQQPLGPRMCRDQSERCKTHNRAPRRGWGGWGCGGVVGTGQGTFPSPFPSKGHSTQDSDNGAGRTFRAQGWGQAKSSKQRVMGRREEGAPFPRPLPSQGWKVG